MYNRNVHEYTIKCYNSDFHGEGLLDTDVREVSSFYRKTKASLRVRIQKFSGPYFPTFEPKKLQIRTLFTQCVWQQNYFHPIEVTRSMYFGNILQIMCMYENLKVIEIIQIVSKLTVFLHCEFLLSFTGVCTNKKFEIMKP